MTADLYKEFTIPLSNVNKDIAIAWLDYFGFEMILEEEDQLKAYIPSDLPMPEVEAIAEKIKIESSAIKILEIQNQNWNKEWESNFSPVVIENKCRIRAAFHDADSSLPFEILISPKMAFGTGHHATTYMMIDQMFSLDFSGKKVLDYGCGTGILSVFAALKSAEFVNAIDIEKQSVENTKEHICINEIKEDLIHVGLGDLDVIKEGDVFDIILANINRGVLLSQKEQIFNRLHEGGILLLSGILQTDKSIITDAYQGQGFQIQEIQSRGDWLCFRLQKPISTA